MRGGSAISSSGVTQGALPPDSDQTALSAPLSSLLSTLLPLLEPVRWGVALRGPGGPLPGSWTVPTQVSAQCWTCGQGFKWRVRVRGLLEVSGLGTQVVFPSPQLTSCSLFPSNPHPPTPNHIPGFTPPTPHLLGRQLPGPKPG